MAINYTDVVPMFTPGVVGIGATTTTRAFDVSKRELILLVFTASNISSGNGVFTVDGSLDNSYWVTGITFVNTQQTNTQGTVGIVSKQLTANGAFGARVLPGWHYLRVKVTVTTDGRYTATLGSAG